MGTKATKSPFLGSGVPVLGNKSKEANFLWIFWAWHKDSASPRQDSRLCNCSKEGWSLKNMHRVICKCCLLTFDCSLYSLCHNQGKKITECCITELAKDLKHREIIIKTSADSACLWVECYMQTIRLPVESSWHLLILLHTWVKAHLPASLPRRRTCPLPCEISSACLSGLLCCNLGG